MSSCRTSHRRPWLALASLVGGVLCAAPLGGQDLPAPTQNAIAGAAVFGEKGCVRCHSVSGEGNSLGPDLRAAAGARSFEDLTAALWNHLPQMAGRMEELGIERPVLSNREAGDLFAYLFTMGYFDERGDPARGGVTFREAGCIRCHQVRGVGGVVGPLLDGLAETAAPIEVAAAMWNHGPAMLEAAAERNIPRPALSGAQLRDLIAFVRGDAGNTPDRSVVLLPGDALEGRAVLDERECVACHGPPGAGGGSAPDLAGIGRGLSLIDFVAAMWNKAPVMIAALRRTDRELPRLEAHELADIVAYLYSVNYFSGGGSAVRGRTLVRTRGCVRCHQEADLAARPGLDHPASITAALWNHLSRAGAAGEAGDADGWPTFTGREMGDLMAYFQASTR